MCTQLTHMTHDMEEHNPTINLSINPKTEKNAAFKLRLKKADKENNYNVLLA